MTLFRQLSEGMFVAPQIELADIEQAKAEGVTTIINNRPDGEDPDAPQGPDVEAAVQAAGLSYVSIPVGHSGFSEPQIDQTIAALESAQGSTLAYCRSGTRSTLLWALAQAKLGEKPERIAQAAIAAGYDIGPIRPMLDMLAKR